MPSSSSAYDAVVEAIYRAGIEPERWPQTLTQVADHVGALGGMIAYHAPALGAEFMVIGRLRQDLTDLYLRRYAHNPYSAAMMHVELGVVHTAEQLADHAAVEKTAFYADILVPQAIWTHLLVGHPSLTQRGTSGGIAFQLSRRQAAEIAPATRRLSRLVPHLMRGVELSLQVGRTAAATRQIQHLIEAIPNAALLLDRTGMITAANRAAEILLAEDDGLGASQTLDGLRFTATSEGERKALALRIAQALKSAAGEEGELGGALQITRPSGRAPLVVLVIPLPPMAFSLYASIDGGERVLVQIIDPQPPAEAKAEHLAVAVGLTQAEQRVAALIGSGMAAPDVARTLGLSLATVKTHLTRCFDKTGVRSQAALAHLVATVFAAARPFTPSK